MKSLDIDLRDPSFYNPIINGNMDFWQRATTNTRTQGQSGRTADRHLQTVSSGVSKSITINQSSSLPSGLLVQSSYSFEYVNNTAVASFPASEYIEPFSHIIEGVFLQPLYNKDFTVGFWLYSSFAGTFPIAIRNGAATFSYVTTVAVTAGWDYYSFVVPWNSNITHFGNNGGISISLGFISGTTYQAPSLNTWTSGNYISHSSATNYFATVSSTIRICQLQMRSGQIAKEDMKNSFRTTGMDYPSEFKLCQRYYQRGFQKKGVFGSYASTAVSMRIPTHVTMRTSPVVAQIPGTSLTTVLERIGIVGVTPSGLSPAGAVTPDYIHFDFSYTGGVAFEPCSLQVDIIQGDADF